MKQIAFLTILISKFYTSYGQNPTKESAIRKCSFSLEGGLGIINKSYREPQPAGYPFLVFNKISQRFEFSTYINIKKRIGIRASFAVNSASMGESVYLPILEAQYNIKDNFNPHQGEPPTSYGIINRKIYGVGLDYLLLVKKTAINFSFIPGLVTTKYQNFNPSLQHKFLIYDEVIDRKIVFNERYRNSFCVTLGSTVRLLVNRRMSPIISIKYFWMPAEKSNINVVDSLWATICYT